MSVVPIVDQVVNQVRQWEDLISATGALREGLIRRITPEEVEAKETGLAEVVRRGPETENWVALTFDDWGGGESMEGFEWLLNLLRKYSAQATVFPIGSQAERKPDLLIRALNQGVEIGNHTYGHLCLYGMGRVPTDDEIKTSILEANQVITQATGVSPRLFRPPKDVWFHRKCLFRSSGSFKKDYFQLWPSLCYYVVQRYLS